MWRKLGIFIFIILFLAFSGCSQINPQASPPTATVTPTPVPASRYTMGDLVKSSPTDDIGKVIVDYNLKNQKYTVRTVVFDEFGRIYYIKELGTQSVPFATFESSYPIKAGSVDNPSAIQEVSLGKPKFGVGSIHRINEFANTGIIILSYDYVTEKYTYATAYYEGGGKWDYDPGASQSESRVILEDRYKK